MNDHKARQYKTIVQTHTQYNGQIRGIVLNSMLWLLYQVE
jgi:hypothetical protein